MITAISQLAPNSTYTYADYLTWRFDESAELIRGNVSQLPTPKRIHQAILGNLTNQVFGYLDNRPEHVYHRPFDVRLPVQNRKRPDQIYTVVQPDICVVCDLTKLDDDGCLGAPDWIIEITSPRTAKYDFDEKFHLYEQSGVREYWIIQPKEKAVNVYVLETDEFALVDIYESGEIPCQLFPELIVPHERIFR